MSNSLLASALDLLQDDENEYTSAAFAAALILGIEETRLAEAVRRNPSRLYLRRPQLLPNPRTQTPWQVLYESSDDRAFRTTMGFNTAIFHKVLHAGFAVQWDTGTIP